MDSGKGRGTVALGVEALEDRNLPAATPILAGTLLAVTGGPGRDDIRLALDAAAGQVVVYDSVFESGRFALGSVTALVIDGGPDRARITIDRRLMPPATGLGTDGNDILEAGGGGATLLGGPGNDKLIAGRGPDVLDGDGGFNQLFRVRPDDLVVPQPGTRIDRGVVP